MNKPNPENRCANCSVVNHCKNSTHSWIFFIIGLIATFSIRLVAIFMNYNLIYAKIVWYIGIIGFFIFFLYKFTVERSRSRLITNQSLVSKLRKREPLTDKDYEVASSVLCSLSASKDTINYFIIFSTSVITLLFALYEDFIK